MKKDSKLLVLLRELAIAWATAYNFITSPIIGILSLPIILYYVPQYLPSHILAIVILLIVWKAPEHD
jgi:hypothetical protein